MAEGWHPRTSLVAALVAALALLGFQAHACAAERAVPVFLAVHDDIGVATRSIKVVDPVHGPSVATGIGSLVATGVGALANRSVNKHSAVKVARFNAAIAPLDLAAEASHFFGCVGVPACGDVVAFTDPELFQKALDQDGSHKGIVVELTPELVPSQLMIRTVAREFDLVEGKVVERRALTAVYTVRSPLATDSNFGKQPDGVDSYWREGTPNRLAEQTRRGLQELDRMLTRLAAELSPTGSWPEPWSKLPKVRSLADSGRVKCSGMAWCAITYVLEDAGDHLVLVEKNGAAMGWFDAKAAAAETNLPALVMLGLSAK